ncbi:MAG: response regulator [Deltaproteobacteria bacterium]|nr:response regulator [Deltaproteobacteria bacterium]MBA3819107.1 response regulator [Deltaproteobacteria bacterium]
MAGMERTLLVVDDDRRWLRAAQRTLRSTAFTVLVAETADETRQLASQAPQLAIVDVYFAGEPLGFGMVRELRTRVPGIKIALCSAMLMDAPAVCADADLVVTKPFSLPKLIARLEALPARPVTPLADLRTLKDAERDHVRQVLARCGGNVSGAARVLGMTRTGLQHKLKKLKLR